MEDLKEYQIDGATKRIVDCGKFEGESLATVFYWQYVMDGGAETDVHDGDVVYSYFYVTQDDVLNLEHKTGLEFPELVSAVQDGDLYRVWERSDGFVIGQIVSEQVLRDHEEEVGIEGVEEG